MFSVIIEGVEVYKCRLTGIDDDGYFFPRKDVHGSPLLSNLRRIGFLDCEIVLYHPTLKPSSTRIEILFTEGHL